MKREYDNNYDFHYKDRSNPNWIEVVIALIIVILFFVGMFSGPIFSEY